MAPDGKVAEPEGRDRTAATVRLPPVGFWSYARQDDQLSSGRLSALRALLMHELQQQYGREPIHLFQDANTIPHGADWEKEIKKALDTATFFIPIVTPNFIQSEWCCREVELFLERERQLGALHPDIAGNSRIFPILFIGVDDVDPENPEVLASLQKLQWFDFRPFRHRDFGEAAVREALSDLAGTMGSLLRRKVALQAATTSAPTVVVPAPPEARPAAPGQSARPIEVGDVLNHMFEVKRAIKAGGMGQVFEGSNVITGERVAIKALLPALAADPKVIEMFQREAITLTRLQHEALVQYRVLAKEPQLGALYIVTEYVDGVDLGEALDKVDRAPKELAALLGRLASGLAAAHRLGAIHRDMSPDNVMLPDGDLHRAKIIDFGIAKDLAGNLPTLIGNGFAGKLGFVAPEQLGDHDGQIGSWTDVYSLALVILSVANGEKPDMGGAFADAIRKRRALPDLSAVPDDLRALLADMLRPDPAERVRTMDEVLARLAAPVMPAAPPPLPVMAEDAADEVTETPTPAVPPAPILPQEMAEPEAPARPKLWLWLGLGTVGIAILAFMLLRPDGPPGTGDAAAPPSARPAALTPAIAAPSAPDPSWLFGSWCLIDRESGGRRAVRVGTSQRIIWTIRNQNGRIVTDYGRGSTPPEQIRQVGERTITTGTAVYTLDPNGRSLSIREGATPPTQLEKCR